MSAALAALLLAAPLPGTVLADWTPAEVAARADRVDLGVVVARTPVRRGGELYTDVTLRVEETLKGAPRSTMVLTQLGGVDARGAVELVGDARLPVGARVVLFTRAHRDGRRHLVGMSLGAYRVLEGGRVAQDIDAPLIRGGALRPAPGRRLSTLEALRALVRP